MNAFLNGLLTTFVGAGGVAVLFGALVKSWFQLQLERFKREQSEQLEAVKANLSLVVRLRSTGEEKRSEVAAQVLISCLQFLDFLHAVTSPAHFGSSQEPGNQGFKKEIYARWQGAHDLIMEYSKCWALAEAYLPSEAGDLMDRIWKQRSDIWANQSTHFDVVAQGGRSGPLYEGGFGETARSRVTALRGEAKTLLRPIAQLATLPSATRPDGFLPQVAAVPGLKSPALQQLEAQAVRSGK